MNRFVSSISAAALLATLASAQCLDTSAPGTLIGLGDDTYFTTHYPLGFAFPMANSALGTYTHFRVNCNGWIILTDGVTTPGVGLPASYGSVASVLGAVGGAPRLLAFARDLNLTAANNGGVYFDNTTNPGVSCTVTWKNAVDFSNVGAPKDIRIELFATGAIKLAYSPNCNVAGAGAGHVAVSTGNGVVDPGQSDLSTGPVTASDAIYQIFPTGTFDLRGAEMLFTPGAGPGGWSVVTTCQLFGASHTNYGSGCYNISDSIYEYFANAAVASTALNGQSLVFTPVGSQYVMSWGGGTYVAPTGGAVNVFLNATDDAESVITPSVPFASPTGPQASVRLHSNGVLSWGAAAQTFPGTSSWTPTAAAFLGAGNTAMWAWHDFNESEAGSGRIKREEVVVGADTILYVTWDNVENYSVPAVVNPSTIQFQINLTTGVVTIVWQSVDNQVTSVDGTQHLVGWSPAGASNNGGSINLATALPLVTQPLNAPAMTLVASPAPISTPSTGTLVTYTQNNIPEAAPASGVYVGVTILSTGQNLPGTDLGFLGMPGCNLHITSFDAMFAFVGAANSLTTQFAIPSGVAYGVELFAQSAALIVPNSLANGQNAFGATVSNGVASFISAF